MSNGVQVERIKFFIYAFGLGSELGRVPKRSFGGAPRHTLVVERFAFTTGQDVRGRVQKGIHSTP